jgi:hypothetical protein
MPMSMPVCRRRSWWTTWRGALVGTSAIDGLYAWSVAHDVCDLKPYYSASATSGGGVPASSREKESQREDESIDGHGRWCSGSLDRWCYVDRTIGLGW